MGKLNLENCLAYKFPEISKQWHPTKNGKLTPEMVTYSSHKNIWWICKNNHEWNSTVNKKTRKDSKGNGCPYCSGRKISIDNCLSTTDPELSKEWHPTKNGLKTPNNVTRGNNKKFWWICSKNHSYIATIKNRAINKSECPYCSGRMPTKDNCLLIKNPILCREWDYKKNIDITPDKVKEFTNKSVWWICKNNHSFKAKISKRSLGEGCPYCSGNKVSDKNSLINKNPEICKEWDYEKNGKLTPETVSFASNKKAWWKCHKNHEWESTVGHRHNGGKCPYCSKIELKDGSLCDSIPEAIKYIEYKENGLKFEHNKRYHKNFGKCRYDFYFPQENKYIEVTSYNKKYLQSFPGRYFHYLRKIVKKKRFVENFLKAEFEFIQFTPTWEQIKKVRECIL